MTAHTPEQYRALADSIDAAQAWTLEYSVVEVGRALRAAADQLEAVRAVFASTPMPLGLHVALSDAILTADTAPQVQREWPPADDGSDLTWRERNDD